MQDPHVQNWLAAYLYHGEPWEELLSKAVRPLVGKVLDEGLADGYFFIRYWERGPHVRLRFHGQPKILEEKVKPMISDHFTSWFEEHPNERDESLWSEETRAELFPNNSVQFITYEPEYTRYGGQAGIVVSERQFEASSNAIFATLDSVEDWTYERALGLAIQMHLGFAYALQMPPEELRAFFQRISLLWMGRAYYLPQDAPVEEHQRLRNETNEAFAQAWSGQKDGLISFCRTLWTGLHENADFDQKWFSTWLTAMDATRKELHAAADQIDFPEFFVPPPSHLPVEHTRYWPILESYIHMTNNRLGILNRDEAFLGYLIDQSMQTILAEDTQ